MNSVAKILMTCATAATLAFTTTSCSDDKDNIIETTYTSYFNRIEDPSGNYFLNDGVTYVIANNQDANTFSVTIKNFKLEADGPTYGSVTIKDMPVVEGVVRQGTVTSSGDVSITDFTISTAGTYYVMSFKSGAYTVNTFPAYTALVNKNTSVVPDNGGTTYTSTDKIGYLITFDPKKSTATITVSGPKFSADMPANLVLTYPSIPVHFEKSGFNLTAPEIIPTYNDTPFPAFTLSNITGHATLAYPSNMTLNYHVKGQGTVSTTLVNPYAAMTN